MTSERDKADTDELVSDTYRELSAPKTPEHLNQSVLRMAAGREGGKKGLLFAAWMKPVAWAATIALSLAIVIEYSEVPTTPIAIDIAPVGESIRDEFAPTGAVLEEMILEDASPMKSEAKGKHNSFAASSPAAARPAARKLAADALATDQPDSGPDNSIRPALERQVTTEPVSPTAASLEKKESDSASACDAEARQSAASWMECIAKLRESGAVLDADREYEAFILKYPAESAN